MPAGSRAGFFLPSRDARLAITRGEETRFVLVSIENPAQPPRPLPALEGLIPSGWDGAGRTLYALERGTSGRLYLFDVESGRRTPWMEVAPDDRVGFTGLLNFMATPDLKAYAYSYVRQLSELFVVSGIE
jgi:hypothetical protein